VEDYNLHPALCRFGVWVGCEEDFVESVVLSYEHDPDPLYVGWALNGTVVSQPGFPPTIFPPGNPVPGTLDVVYMTPVDDLYHRISLTGTSGMTQRCVYAQVLYMTYQDYVNGIPPTYGPALTVCLSGQSITWPADKLEETRECIKHWWEIFRERVGPVPVGPGDPVEDWLARATPEQAFRLKAYADALETLHAERDAIVIRCLLLDLRAIISELVYAGRLATPSAQPESGVVEAEQREAE